MEHPGLVQEELLGGGTGLPAGLLGQVPHRPGDHLGVVRADLPRPAARSRWRPGRRPAPGPASPPAPRVRAASAARPDSQFPVDVAPADVPAPRRSASATAASDNAATCAASASNSCNTSTTSSSPADHHTGGDSCASRSRIRPNNTVNRCRVRPEVITSTTKILNPTTDNPADPSQSPKPKQARTFRQSAQSRPSH